MRQSKEVGPGVESSEAPAFAAFVEPGLPKPSAPATQLYEVWRHHLVPTVLRGNARLRRSASRMDSAGLVTRSVCTFAPTEDRGNESRTVFFCSLRYLLFSYATST